jgi:hypothetical protein
MLQLITEPGIGRCSLPSELGIAVGKLLSQPPVCKCAFIGELLIGSGVLSLDDLIAAFSLALDPDASPAVRPDGDAYGCHGHGNGTDRGDDVRPFWSRTDNDHG